MKKKISYLIIFTLIVIMPINIKALTGSISIKCDKENYSINDTATCKVTGTSDEEVKSVAAKVSSENLNVSFVTDSIWQGTGNDGNIQLYSDKGQTGTFNIGTLKISVKDSSYGVVSGIVTLCNVKYSDVAVGDSQIQVSFVNGSNNSNTDNNSNNNSGGNNSNNGNSGNNTSGLNNNSNSSINNPKTSDFKIGIIISLITITLIISILGYKRLKKLLKN